MTPPYSWTERGADDNKADDRLSLFCCRAAVRWCRPGASRFLRLCVARWWQERGKTRPFPAIAQRESTWVPESALKGTQTPAERAPERLYTEEAPAGSALGTICSTPMQALQTVAFSAPQHGAQARGERVRGRPSSRATLGAWHTLSASASLSTRRVRGRGAVRRATRADKDYGEDTYTEVLKTAKPDHSAPHFMRIAFYIIIMIMRQIRPDRHFRTPPPRQVPTPEVSKHLVVRETSPFLRCSSLD